ncbi:hypothetical protein M5D96_008400, partial [Drosophila gunungcola]
METAWEIAIDDGFRAGLNGGRVRHSYQVVRQAQSNCHYWHMLFVQQSKARNPNNNCVRQRDDGLRWAVG